MFMLFVRKENDYYHWERRLRTTLEGHSNVEDEEKLADGQENERTRKGRRMSWSTATALCLSSANQRWVCVHESYSD